jgi:ribonuclease E
MIAAEPPAAPPVAEQARRGARAPEAPEESPNFFDERFDFEEPFDLLESAEAAESVEPAEAAESAEALPTADEPTAETGGPRSKRPRRRRRRRRGGGEHREGRDANAPAGEDRSAEIEPTLAGEELPQELVASEAETEAISGERPDVEGEAGEPAERRPKRRRSRRGRKRRSGETAEAADKPAETPSELAADDLSEVHLEAAEADVAADEDFGLADGGFGATDEGFGAADEGLASADEGLELEEGDEGDDQRSPRLGFRGIPTWEEAVGLIVNKNIETRAKRPNGGAQHGRGHRGPRDNRGGRGGKRRPS